MNSNASNFQRLFIMPVFFIILGLFASWNRVSGVQFFDTNYSGWNVINAYFSNIRFTSNLVEVSSSLTLVILILDMSIIVGNNYRILYMIVSIISFSGLIFYLYKMANVFFMFNDRDFYIFSLGMMLTGIGVFLSALISFTYYRRSRSQIAHNEAK